MKKMQDLLVDPFWKKLLSQEFDKKYFIELEKFLNSEFKNKKIYPKYNEIFNALNLTSFENVKVVIIGQDPYHGEGQANGLSFSVNKNIKIPPSLVNIYKELNSDLGFDIPKSGDLSNWAKEGVLLLNNVLTVEDGSPGIHHQKGWEIFTDRVIELLNEHKKNIVFILWGAPAQKKGHNIDELKHLVLKSPHPSPLSSYRGFFGSRPFSQTNQYLLKNGLEKLNWNLNY